MTTEKIKNKVNRLSVIFLSYIFVGLLYSFPVIAQGYLVHEYTEERGLPNSKTIGITQDANGYMWFSTKSGIASFNGIDWKTYQINDLPNANDSYLFPDKFGRVWTVINSNSLSIKVFENGYWRTHGFFSTPIRVNDYPTIYYSAIINERTTKFLISVYNVGLFIHENGKFTKINEKIPFNDIRKIEADDYNFYICTKDEIYILNAKNELSLLNPGLPPGEIYSIAIEKSNNNTSLIYVFGEKYLGYIKAGVYNNLVKSPMLINRYPKNFTKLIPNYFNRVVIASKSGILLVNKTSLTIDSLSKSNGLADPCARDIFLDRESNLWIASDRGVSKVSSMRFSNYLRTDGMQEGEVTSIIELSKGKFLLGHNKSISLFENKKFQNVPFPKDLQPARVFDIEKGPSGRVYVAGENSGLLEYKNGKLVPINIDIVEAKQILSVKEDQTGNLFVLLEHGIYCRKKGSNKFELVHSVYPRGYKKLFLSPNNEIFATTGHGIVKNVGDKWVVFRSTVNNFNNTNCLNFDMPGMILIGTAKGICYLSGDSIKKFKPESIPLNKSVYFIARSHGLFWFGTDGGVVSWDGKRTRSYGVAEGLSGLETNRDAGYVDYNGDLWIGTNNGLSRFNKDLDNINYPKPIVRINQLTVSDQIVKLGSFLSLSSEMNNLDFKIDVLSFINENKNSITYQMYPVKKLWSKEENPQYAKIIFSNLTPGQYKLKVRVCNAMGIWSDEFVTGIIEIESPFSRKPAILILFVLFIIVAIWMLVIFTGNQKYKNKLEVEVINRTSELAESEKRYKQMFVGNNAIMLLFDSQTLLIIDANPAALNFYNLSEFEIKNIHIKELFSNYNETIENQLRNIHTNKLLDAEHKALNEIRNVNIHASVINYQDQSVIYAIIEDITEKIIAESKLIQREQEFKALVEHSPDIIARFDRNLRYVYVNPAVETVFGKLPDEFINKTLEETQFPKKLADKLNSLILKSFVDKVSCSVDYEVLTLDGMNFFDIRIVPELNPDGEVSNVLAINRNITERKIMEGKIININSELEARVKQRTSEFEQVLIELKSENNIRKRTEVELNKANEKLHFALEKEKELGEMKSRFISMISHEYRTPMTVILSSAYIIKESIKRGLYDHIDNNIQKIHTSVNAMSRLLEDVLNFGRSQDGKLTYNETLVRLKEFVVDIIEEVKVLDQEKHGFELISPDEINLYTDRYLLRQIVINLIMNATKFSPKNTIVKINIVENENTFTISVVDQGPGILEEDKHRIFEPFYRNEKAIGIIPGAGLGLAIVQRCADVIEAKIDVDNVEPSGAKFDLTIPKVVKKSS